MNLGYACINMTLGSQKPKITTNRSMIKKTFLERGLNYAGELSLKNVEDLFNILEWNNKNNIKFFRLSSDIFPWASEYGIENLPKVLNKDDQSFDMIWCDVGGLQNYVTQLNMLGPFLPNHIDGYLIFHSTLSNVHGLAFLNQIKLDILSGKMPNFEIMSFFEPHKNRQNSFTILRKKGELSSRIYSEQP